MRYDTRPRQAPALLLVLPPCSSCHLRRRRAAVTVAGRQSRAADFSRVFGNPGDQPFVGGFNNNSGRLRTLDPCDWFGATCDGRAVTGLCLGSNRLSGSTSSEVGDLTGLTVLELYADDLSGEIPSVLGSLTNLTGLYLYQNQLSGPVPPQLQSNLSALTSMLRRRETGYFTTATPALAAWLTCFEPLWNGGCPAPWGAITEVAGLGG